MSEIELYRGNWRCLVIAIFKITKRDLNDQELSGDAKHFIRTWWAEELLSFLGYNQEVVLKTWGII